MSETLKRRCDIGKIPHPAAYYVKPFYLCVDHYQAYSARKKRLADNKQRGD